MNSLQSILMAGCKSGCRNVHFAMAFAVKNPYFHNFKTYEVTKCFEQAFTAVVKANTLLLNNLLPKESPQSVLDTVLKI